MDKYKQMKRLALFAIPHALIVLLCLLMIICGLATPFINGFAVDAQENLYVGEGKTICIFQDGIQTRKINMKSNTYAFTINSANELIVAYPSTVYRMDTTGNIIEKWEDPHTETYQKIRNGSGVVTSPNGNKYRKTTEFGWTRILKNESEKVYSLSVVSFTVKLLVVLCALSLFINGALFVHSIARSSKVDQS